jgi:hypothetical protein
MDCANADEGEITGGKAQAANKVASATDRKENRGREITAGRMDFSFTML